MAFLMLSEGMETARALRRVRGLGWAGFVLVAASWLTLAPFPDRVIVAGEDLAFVAMVAVAVLVVAHRAALFTGRRRQLGHSSPFGRSST